MAAFNQMAISILNIATPETSRGEDAPQQKQKDEDNGSLILCGSGAKRIRSCPQLQLQQTEGWWCSRPPRTRDMLLLLCCCCCVVGCCCCWLLSSLVVRLKNEGKFLLFGERHFQGTSASRVPFSEESALKVPC